jgi:hypothetical protein
MWYLWPKWHWDRFFFELLVLLCNTSPPWLSTLMLSPGDKNWWPQSRNIVYAINIIQCGYLAAVPL